jgi:hypothetical protein
MQPYGMAEWSVGSKRRETEERNERWVSEAREPKPERLSGRA